MRIIITFFLLLASSYSFTQDFLHFKTGEVIEVKIFYLDKEKDLLGYELEGEKKYQSISSLNKYVLNSELNLGTPKHISNGRMIESVVIKEFDSQQGNYEFGKWSVSTDLFSLLALNRNSIVTLEPEYEVNSQFSVRIPLRFGLSNYFFFDYFYYETGDYWASYIANEPPHNDYIPTRGFYDQLVFEVGITPKYYFYSKSGRFFSPYVAASLKAGMWFGQTEDFYIGVDTLTSQNNTTNWYINDLNKSTNELNIPFINTELLIGVDLVFSRVLNLTFETGLDINMGHGDLGTGYIYTKYFKNDYALAGQIYNNFYNNVQRRFRVLLTYRFNGKKI